MLQDRVWKLRPAYCRRTRPADGLRPGRGGAVQLLIPVCDRPGRVRSRVDPGAAAGADDGFGVLAVAVSGAGAVAARGSSSRGPRI